jgi:hypothetical protein
MRSVHRLNPSSTCRRRLIAGSNARWNPRRQAWVVRLREAFPLQMNDFDRQLEIDLARMLDRVVRTPVPPRSGRRGTRPFLRLLSDSGAPISASGDKPAADAVAIVSEGAAAATLSF